MNRIWVAAALIALVGGFATAAQANPIPIYNTGTNAAGTGLATAGGIDPHWVVTSTPASSATVNAYDAANQPGAWTTVNSANSQWISPIPGARAGQAGGNYSYQTTFDLTGLIPSTATLSGSFSADDCVTDILINGSSTGIGNASCLTANYASFLSFNISTGFMNGINTLTFLVFNRGTGAGATGLNVLVHGTAQPLPVPEPSTLGLLGLALLGLGGLWIRRRTT